LGATLLGQGGVIYDQKSRQWILVVVAGYDMSLLTEALLRANTGWSRGLGK